MKTSHTTQFQVIELNTTTLVINSSPSTSSTHVPNQLARHECNLAKHNLNKKELDQGIIYFF